VLELRASVTNDGVCPIAVAKVQVSKVGALVQKKKSKVGAWSTRCQSHAVPPKKAKHPIMFRFRVKL
jgi:hypothetical protein